MDFAPGPLSWLPGALFIVMLVGAVVLIAVPAFRPWRVIGWALLAGVLALLGAAFAWTWMLDAPRS